MSQFGSALDRTDENEGRTAPSPGFSREARSTQIEGKRRKMVRPVPGNSPMGVAARSPRRSLQRLRRAPRSFTVSLPGPGSFLPIRSAPLLTNCAARLSGAACPDTGRRTSVSVPASTPPHSRPNAGPGAAAPPLVPTAAGQAVVPCRSGPLVATVREAARPSRPQRREEGDNTQA